MKDRQKEFIRRQFQASGIPFTEETLLDTEAAQVALLWSRWTEWRKLVQYEARNTKTNRLLKSAMVDVDDLKPYYADMHKMAKPNFNMFAVSTGDAAEGDFPPGYSKMLSIGSEQEISSIDNPMRYINMTQYKGRVESVEEFVTMRGEPGDWDYNRPVYYGEW